jgi:hypothetical protein
MNIIDHARELAKHSEDVELAYATLELCSQHEAALRLIEEATASIMRIFVKTEGV